MMDSQTETGFVVSSGKEGEFTFKEHGINHWLFGSRVHKFSLGRFCIQLGLVLRLCLPSHQPSIILPDYSKDFAKTCQDLHWNRDTISHVTVHRPNGVAERPVRRVKKVTTVALFQSGLPDDWWTCSMSILFLCYMRRTQGQMANQHSEHALVKFLPHQIISIGSSVEYLLFTAKDASRTSQWKEER